MNDRKGIMALLAVLVVVSAAFVALQADTDGSSGRLEVLSVAYDDGTVSYSVGMSADHAFLQIRDGADGIVYLGPRIDASDGSVTGGFAKTLGLGSYKLWVQDSDGNVAQRAFTVSGPAPVHSIDVTSATYVDGVVSYSVETDLDYAFLQIRDARGGIVYLGPRIDASDGSMEGSFRKSLPQGEYILWVTGGDADVSDGMAFNVPATRVDGVTLDRGSLELFIGDEANLVATVSPGDATNPDVVWTSSDGDVASVDDGRVVALGKGSATITVSTVDGGFTATCEVAVSVPVGSVVLDRDLVRLEVGGSATLRASVEPYDASYGSLAWASSDESVVTVVDGVVSAVGHGVATVSVRAEGWEPVAECTVSVLAPSTDVEVEPGVSGGVATVDPSDVSEALGGSVDGPVNIVVNASDLAVKSVVIDADSVRSMADAGASVTFGTANGAVTLDPQTLASLADAGELSIAVDHEPVLTDGQADFVGQDHKSFEIIVSVGGTERSTFGNGMLDVFLPYDMDGRDRRYVGFYHVTDSGDYESVDFEFVEGGITATLRHLSVYSIVYGEDVAVTGVTLNKSSMTLVAGGSETLVEEVLPAKAAVRTVTWTSSDPSVASVDFKGRVVALKAGTAVVTVTTVDGGFTASCTVFVASQGTDVPVTGVALDRDSLTMAPGDTGSLVATVSPSDATLNGVSWASSDPSVVKVDPFGRITALGDGTAVVTVTTVDGGFTASCTVTVESESAGSDTGTVLIVVAAIAIVAAAVAAVVLLRRRS